MTKTVFRAVICVYNPQKRHIYDCYDRRVYLDNEGKEMVKLSGSYRKLDDYRSDEFHSSVYIYKR